MKYSDWNDCLLGDVVTLKRGYDLPQKKRIPDNFPIISSSGKIGTHNESKVKGPGVVTGRSGLLGGVYFVKEDFWPLNTTLYVQDFHQNDVNFVYYFLKTLNLGNYNAGSSVPTLNRNHVHGLPVRIPDVNEQKKISSILFSLDKKIELNKEMNKTLEDIAQTLFKRWFVDFEFPNIEGLPYKSSGGKLVNSELGLIPDGWAVKNLNEFVESISKSINKKEKEKAIFLNTSDILEGRFLHHNYSLVNDMPGQAKKLIQKNDILYSEIRPINKRFAYVNFDAEDYVVSTKLMVIRTNEKQFPSKCLYLFLTHQNTINKLQHLAESRSGTFPQITFKELSKFKFALPNINQFKSNYLVLEKLVDQQFNLIRENSLLVELRDTLLPKLMSGEIRIPEAEKEVEECLQKSN